MNTMFYLAYVLMYYVMRVKANYLRLSLKVFIMCIFMFTIYLHALVYKPYYEGITSYEVREIEK